MKPVVTYFFRKPRKGAYSIESLFLNIQKELNGYVNYKNHYLTKPSKGLINRILLCIKAYRLQKGINHITGDINFIALLLNKRNTILTIHDIESLFRKNPVSNFILSFFWLKMPIARSKWVTVVSHETKKKILEHISVNPDKIVVIPNIISTDFQYLPKAFNPSSPNILQIGTKYNKNLERTIAALHGITCTFTIIGVLSDKQKYLLEKYEVKYVNHQGLTDQELREAYAEADIVTFVSLFEGFGMPILEANATGRPVITSNCSSMPEVAGEAALLVDPTNVSEIHEAFKKLIADKRLRKDLIAKGLENVERFSNQAIANKYLDLYNKL